MLPKVVKYLEGRKTYILAITNILAVWAVNANLININDFKAIVEVIGVLGGSAAAAATYYYRKKIEQQLEEEEPSIGTDIKSPYPPYNEFE